MSFILQRMIYREGVHLLGSSIYHNAKPVGYLPAALGNPLRQQIRAWSMNRGRFSLVSRRCCSNCRVSLIIPGQCSTTRSPRRSAHGQGLSVDQSALLIQSWFPGAGSDRMEHRNGFACAALFGAAGTGHVKTRDKITVVIHPMRDGTRGGLFVRPSSRGNPIVPQP